MEADGKTSARLHARIADLLTVEIAEERHPVGAFLIEARLVERFGVSRAPVRRALSRLADEGLVRYEARRGYAVQPGSKDLALASGVPTPPSSDEMGGLGSRHSWEGIYSEVENAITSRIAFGDWQVPETALANHFDVSRTVARDVLARLQSRGLVTMNGGRWIVPALTSRRVDELYRLRALLEPAALKEAAPLVPAAFLAGLIEVIDRALLQPPDGKGLDALEIDLHVSLLGHCRNTVLIEAIRQPQALLIAHRFLYRQTRDLNGAEPFIAEHRAILQALADGESDRGADLLHAHLMGSRARAMSRIAALPELSAGDEVSYLRFLRT